MTHLLKAVDRWTLLKHSADMEDLCVHKYSSPYLSRQSVPYSLLPSWVIMKQTFSRSSLAHGGSAYDAQSKLKLVIPENHLFSYLNGSVM